MSDRRHLQELLTMPLVQRILVYNPADRLDAATALQHAYFAASSSSSSSSDSHTSSAASAMYDASPSAMEVSDFTIGKSDRYALEYNATAERAEALRQKSAASAEMIEK